MTDVLHARTLGRVVRTDPRCPPDTVAWHGLMAGWMAAMLAVPVPRGYDAVALGLFAAGAAWAGIRLIAPRSRAAYLRLCICCGGMVVMLLPAATVAASSSQALASMPSGMPGMAPANRPTASAAAVPRSVTLLLLAALLLVVVSQAIAVSRRRGAHRLARGLEIGTAAAMATMLGLAL